MNEDQFIYLNYYLNSAFIDILCPNRHFSKHIQNVLIPLKSFSSPKTDMILKNSVWFRILR